MPTGYTSPVADGKITDLRSFALSCARGFGALIMMRDEPADAPVTDAAFKPADYHVKELADAERRMARLRTLSHADLVAERDADYARALDAYTKAVADIATRTERYKAMRHKVSAWNPPTEDHASLRTFMLEQIDQSIRFDSYAPTAPVRLSPEEWLGEQVKRAARDIEYHTREHAEEVARCAQRRAWYETLVASLPD